MLKVYYQQVVRRCTSLPGIIDSFISVYKNYGNAQTSCEQLQLGEDWTLAKPKTKNLTVTLNMTSHKSALVEENHIIIKNVGCGLICLYWSGQYTTSPKTTLSGMRAQVWINHCFYDAD